MARIVFEGLLNDYPSLKIITHHMGGMVPYFEGRVGPGWDQLGSRTSDENLGAVLERLKTRPIDLFRMFCRKLVTIVGWLGNYTCQVQP